MIPKRAIFFWEGEQRSWLRQQSIETFSALNPTWEVEIIDGKGLPIPGDSRLERVLRSDWARYRRIFEVGGFYFDTDIVFCRPIVDEWLQHEIVLTMGEVQAVHNVAVLGGMAGCRWYETLKQACEMSWHGETSLNYQHFGVLTTNKMATGLIGRDVKWLDPGIFIPVRWNDPQELWKEGGNLSPYVVGVHWFGGDWLAISQEDKIGEAWARKSTCMIGKAWRKAMSTNSEAKVIREQHGLL